jgi:hypothetical protein
MDMGFFQTSEFLTPGNLFRQGFLLGGFLCLAFFGLFPGFLSSKQFVGLLECFRRPFTLVLKLL